MKNISAMAIDKIRVRRMDFLNQRFWSVLLLREATSGNMAVVMPEVINNETLERVRAAVQKPVNSAEE